MPATGFTEPFDRVEIGRKVDHLQDFTLGFGRAQPADWNAGILDPVLDSPQTCDSFRVMGTGLVLVEAGMSYVEHRCITRGRHLRTLPQVSVRGRIERLRVRGTWPGRVEITAGWAKAVVRPWNDDIDAASVRLERGGARFLASCARMAAEWSPEVLSPATLPSAMPLWREAGFVETNRLLLMEHDLRSVDRPASLIVAGGAEPIEELDAIDAEAFNPRWRLGRLGLAESVAATNRSAVFRVAIDDTCVGFAIAGVALGAGYLQRLAVAPAARGRGLGSDLVRASLRWARAHGARSMLVNTQKDNDAAASIYRRLGFNDVPGGLLLFRYAPSRPGE
jgi:ribosomal protein S18 acetylase RimI-like enzyme